MRSSHSLDRIAVAFGGTQLVAGAGLLLPATLAALLGLKGCVHPGQHPSGVSNRVDPLAATFIRASALALACRSWEQEREEEDRVRHDPDAITRR